MKSYCTQNSGKCWTCPLMQSGVDCQGSTVIWWDVTTASDAWSKQGRSINPQRIRALLIQRRIPEAEIIVDGHTAKWVMPVDTPRPDPIKPGIKPKP